MTAPRPAVADRHMAETIPFAQAACSALVATAPSIIDLGRHLAQLNRAYDANEAVRQPDAKAPRDWADIRPTHDAKEAQAIIDERIEAIERLIVTIPPASLADAAVQISSAINIASKIVGFELPADEIGRLANQLERVLLGVLPHVATAAGLNLEELDWEDRDALRVHRYSGVGVES